MYTNRQTKTYIWNIEDLENPILLHTHYSMEESIDHNQYIIGDLVRKKYTTAFFYAYT